jgi:hypothetical protein
VKSGILTCNAAVSLNGVKFATYGAIDAVLRDDDAAL